MEKSFTPEMAQSERIQLFASLLAKYVMVLLVGLPLHLIRCFAQFCGIISVSGRIPSKKQGEGICVIHNHPSWLETAVIPLLLAFPTFFSFFEVLCNPSKVPILTPKFRYWKRWWFLPFKLFSTPMIHGDTRKSSEAISRIREALQGGSTVILMPEGGRTHKKGGKSRRYKAILPNGTIREVDAVSSQGFDPSWRVIRRFQPGVAEFMRGCENVKVLPVWVKVSKWWIRITIGEPVTFGKECSSEFIRTTMETILLRLAAEA